MNNYNPFLTESEKEKVSLCSKIDILITQFNDFKESFKEAFKESKDLTTKLQDEYSDTKADIRIIKESTEWISKDHKVLEKRIDDLDRKINVCPICSDKVDIEELSKTISILSEKVQNLTNEINEMKENQKYASINSIGMTTNKIAIIAIVVSLISSIMVAVMSKVF